MSRAKAHDIYGGRSPDRAIATFHNSCARGGLSREDQRLVEEHIEDHVLSKSLKDETKIKTYYIWTRLIDWLPAGYHEPTEAGVKAALQRIRDSSLSERTKETYIVKLKQFYRWLQRRFRKQGVNSSREVENAIQYVLEEYKFKVDRDKEQATDILTERDVATLIDSTSELSHKVLFSLLWASGCRIGEVLTLQLRDCKPFTNGLRGHGFQVELRKSKTTERVIPVLDDKRIHATRYLRMLIEERKRKGAAPEDVLFVNIRGDPLEYRAAKKWLDRACKASGLGTRCYFHGFRKGRATHLATKGWTGPQLNQLLGWKHGSSSPSAYLSRAALDVTEQMAQTLGLKPAEEEVENWRECPGCSAKNDPDKTYCTFCSRPLDAEEVLTEMEAVLERLLRERFGPRINELQSAPDEKAQWK